MKILSKYVFSEFIKLILLSIVALMTLYVVVHFFETVDEFILNHVHPKIVFRYFLFLLPQIFFLMSPYSILLATVFCISSLSIHSELIAMRAGGVSLLSVTTPILLVSIVVTLITIVSNEFIVPFTNQKHYYIKYVQVRKNKPRSIIQENKIWYHSKNNSIWNIDYLNSRAKIFKGVHIFFFEKGNLLTKRIDASYARYDRENWVFEDVYVRRFNSVEPLDSKYYKKKSFQFDEKPVDFYRIERNQNEMSLRNIYKYKQKFRQEGLDSTKYEVDFHYKISYPFICIIMALIGIQFSLISSRSGGVIFSCGTSIIIGTFYYFMFSMFISLGHKGVLPPWVSAWGLNIIAIAIGFYMILRIDTTISFPSFLGWYKFCKKFNLKKVTKNGINR